MKLLMTRWELSGLLCAAANIQSYLDTKEPWNWWAWFIVISGVVIIVGAFFFKTPSQYSQGTD